MLKHTLSHLAMAAVLTWGANAAAGTENDVLFELAMTGYTGHGAGSSLLATQLYAEKTLPVKDVSAFLVVHHDKEFRAVYAGLARKFGDLQLGIGIGNAWYDEQRHPTINPWLYFATDDVEIYATAERYAHESSTPWFYKGYANRRLTDQIFVGAYGEKSVGAGPMIGWHSGNVRVWAVVPIVDRADMGARGIAGVQIEF